MVADRPAAGVRAPAERRIGHHGRRVVAEILVGIVVAWKSIHLVQVNSDIEAMSVPISVAWMYAPLLPAGLLTTVQALADMFASRPSEVEEVSPW